MNKVSSNSGIILGLCLFAGLALLGYQLSDAAIRYKEYERTVTVKGLSEHEYPADVAIWPIQFTVADNDLPQLYKTIDSNTVKIKQFLVAKGIPNTEISFGAPAITDKSAQQYGSYEGAEFRYSAYQTVTVYSQNIELVRSAMREISQLGKQGIVFSGSDYQEYLFTRLNEVKPGMVEEATRQAREVAEKFAEDSQSRLGKIKSASQGRFSISERDRNNPHIKKVRVVSTITYYLSD